MAGRYDLEVDQGADFETTILRHDADGNPISLTGFTAKMQVRAAPNTAQTVLLELTSSAGLVLGGAAGTIIIQISDDQSAALPSSGGYYDLLLTSGGGLRTRLVEGRVVVKPRTTVP